MLYKEDNQFHFYETVTIFYDSRVPGEPRESFTHTPEQMDFILSKSTTINPSSESFVPTAEQTERLTVLNELYTAEQLSHYAAIEFVRYGYIPANSPLESLPERWHTEYITNLKYTVSDHVRKARKDVESAGTTFEYNGTTIPVRTDPETQAKITSAKLALSDPDISLGQTIDWELEPFVWDSVDLEKINLLAKADTNHVQSCFTLSKTQHDQINACTTVQEMLELDLEWVDVKTIHPFSTMVDMEEVI